MSDDDQLSLALQYKTQGLITRMVIAATKEAMNKD
jgi:hypothetical protein